MWESMCTRNVRNEDVPWLLWFRSPNTIHSQCSNGNQYLQNYLAFSTPHHTYHHTSASWYGQSTWMAIHSNGIAIITVEQAPRFGRLWLLPNENELWYPRASASSSLPASDYCRTSVDILMPPPHLHSHAMQYTYDKIYGMLVLNLRLNLKTLPKIFKFKVLFERCQPHFEQRVCMVVWYRSCITVSRKLLYDTLMGEIIRWHRQGH